jgi:hypothetical protein
MGEKRLWQAVILSTIQEWLCGPLRAKRQAEHYLFGDKSELAAVCRSAGMDVGRLRERLTHLRNDRKSAKAPSDGPVSALFAIFSSSSSTARLRKSA